jgi:hypothetical protein
MYMAVPTGTYRQSAWFVQLIQDLHSVNRIFALTVWRSTAVQRAITRAHSHAVGSSSLVAACAASCAAFCCFCCLLGCCCLPGVSARTPLGRADDARARRRAAASSHHCRVPALHSCLTPTPRCGRACLRVEQQQRWPGRVSLPSGSSAARSSTWTSRQASSTNSRTRCGSRSESGPYESASPPPRHRPCACHPDALLPCLQLSGTTEYLVQGGRHLLPLLPKAFEGIETVRRQQ